MKNALISFECTDPQTSHFWNAPHVLLVLGCCSGQGQTSQRFGPEIVAIRDPEYQTSRGRLARAGHGFRNAARGHVRHVGRRSYCRLLRGGTKSCSSHIARCRIAHAVRNQSADAEASELPVHSNSVTCRGVLDIAFKYMLRLFNYHTLFFRCVTT